MRIVRSVMAFGTFDLLHPGHAFFLRFAKDQGERLIVVIGRNETVERLKGRKPVHGDTKRKESVEALGIADEVVLGDRTDHLKIIREKRPDAIVLGYDQTHFTEKLREDLRGIGLDKTKIVRAPAFEPERWKSSKLKTSDVLKGVKKGMTPAPSAQAKAGLRLAKNTRSDEDRPDGTGLGKGKKRTLLLSARTLRTNVMEKGKEHILSCSPQETQEIAAAVARKAQAGDVYLLEGPLGAGKTVFTQGFLAALGIWEAVTSPTYVYELTYETERFTVHHLDLYRVESKERLLALGLEEKLSDRMNVLLVEWPEILERTWSIAKERRTFRILMEIQDKDVRDIAIRSEENAS